METIREKFTIRHDLAKALLGEFIGTMLLLLIGNSVVAQSVLSKGQINEMIGINVGFGLAIVFGVAVSCNLSGGHINPAVSLMFTTFGQLSPLKFVLYTIAQTLGAFVGAAITFLVYYDAINSFDDGFRQVLGPKATAGIFASYPAAFLGPFNGLVDQIVATAAFCFLIAHITDSRTSYPSWTQPILIGTALTMVGTAFSLNCGYPVNPARDFGPRFFTLLAGYGTEVFSYRNYTWFWVPIIGPFMGAVLGGWLYQLAVGFHVTAQPTTIELHNYKTILTDEPKRLENIS